MPSFQNRVGLKGLSQKKAASLDQHVFYHRDGLLSRENFTKDSPQKQGKTKDFAKNSDTTGQKKLSVYKPQSLCYC